MGEQLKLLFITQDFHTNVDRLTYYLEEGLAKVCQFTVWHHGGHIQEILTKLPFQPDFILLNDVKPEYLPDIVGLPELSIPLGALMFDLHWRSDYRKRFILDNRVQHVFTHYRDKFYEWYPELTDRMHWFPLWANTEVFRDYGLTKDIDFLFMGHLGWPYPLRTKILEVMGKEAGFVYHPHPGYRDVDEENEPNVFVGERYAREINRAKMFLTGDSVFHYPVAKYYEILACKTLLLAPCPPELLDLGFVPGEHFVEINEDNFRERAMYYLTHVDERQEITEKGYQLVQTRHTAALRAAQLVSEIKLILKQ